MALYLGSSEKYKGNMCVVEDAALRKEIEDAKKEIEEATGESYEDLTGAVKGAVKDREFYTWWHTNKINGTNNYNYAFQYYPYKTIPYIDLSKATTCGGFASGSQVEHIDWYMDFGSSEKVTNVNMNNTLTNSLKLKRIKGVNTSKGYNLNNLLYNCRALETIEEPLDFSLLTTSINNYNEDIFAKCNNLKNVSFVEETIKVSVGFAHSPLLSNESKQSIFDGLAIVTTAQTVTVHKDVKILQSQVDTANAKGWTVAGGTVVSEEEYYG